MRNHRADGNDEVRELAADANGIAADVQDEHVQELDHGGLDNGLMRRLAQCRVHWVHARFELQAAMPDASLDELRRAYTDHLRAIYQHPALVEMVMNTDLKFVFTGAGWLDAETFAPFRVTRAVAEQLPACVHLAAGENGGVDFEPDAIRIERAKQGFPLDGYTPLRIVDGFSVHDEPGQVTVVRQPDFEEPVRFLDDEEMMPKDELEQLMATSFPGIDLGALQGILAAAICADRTSTPYILHLTGPTGSGKGATVLLAGRILGSAARAIRVEAGAEEWRRQIGTKLASGCRLLLADEIARVRNLDRRIGRFLRLSGQFNFRLLYHSVDRELRWSAAVALTSLTVPAIIAESPELKRRIWVTRLPRQVTDWHRTAGDGGIAAWRRRSPQNAQAANTLLTMAHRTVQEANYQFDEIAGGLGFQRPGEMENALDEGAHIDLYRHARGEFGQRIMNEKPRFVARGWVDANSPAAASILDRLSPDDDGSRGGEHFKRLKHRLEGVDWNQMLGIEEPNIEFRIRRHGAATVFRFQETGRARGQELRNEDLPPAAV